MKKKIGILVTLSALLMVGCQEKEKAAKEIDTNQVAVEETVNVKVAEEAADVVEKAAEVISVQQEKLQNKVDEKLEEVVKNSSEDKVNN